MITDPEIIVRLFIAAAAGGLVGIERKHFNKPAGIRTLMFVSVGSALFTIFSDSFTSSDYSRIASGIVTGIGFLGAGTIFQSKNSVKGLTTAASMWVVAAIGMAAGLGEYIVTLVVTIMVMMILQLKKIGMIRNI